MCRAFLVSFVMFTVSKVLLMSRATGYRNSACRGCHLIEFPGFCVVGVMLCHDCGVAFLKPC